MDASGAGGIRPWYVWMIAFGAAMGGLLFGYDWVVVGGAKPFFELYFHIQDPAVSGWVNSCAMVGCMVGALSVGFLSERWGSRILLMVSALIFVVASLGNACAQSLEQFIVWRICGGVAIGLASSVVPFYLAEIAPPAMRGRLVSVNQLAIVAGLMFAQVVNWVVVKELPDGATAEMIRNGWYGEKVWRWMVGIPAFPGLAFLGAAFLLPDSPLMIGGAVGLALIHGALGACYLGRVSGMPVLILVLGAIACFAMTIAPVASVVISEIFSNRIRGKAMSVVIMALWAACFALTYSFPILNRRVGASWTFWVYGVICIIGALFLIWRLPETKGKTLEQIEKDWIGR